MPSTVYPTIQSIFQQEDNEVIDSLSPAYRELPSTHFSYVSTFNGSITSCCGNNESTILPDSTKTSIHPHTSSLSSEQLNIQRLSNDSTISQPHTSNVINNSCMSMNVAITEEDSTVLGQRSSSTNPDVINDSSLSIHISTAPDVPQQFPMSATSGVIIEGDLTVQRDGNGPVIDPTINDDHSKELAMNDDQRSNESAMNDGQLKEPIINGQRLTESATNNQRLCTEIYGPNYTATTSAKNTNHNAIACDSSRGASSFGGVELSPKTRAFSPDYYALTFGREGSGLSDVSCSSLRGASAFAVHGSSKQQRSPVMRNPSRMHERGASVFGQTSEGLHLENEGSFVMNERREQVNKKAEFLNITYESLLNHKGPQLETERSFTGKETRYEPENEPRINNAAKISPSAAKISPSPNHSVAEVTVNSVHSDNVEDNSSKVQCEDQTSRSSKNTSAVWTIDKRPYSSTKSCKTNVERSETGIKSNLQDDNGNNNSVKSPQIYNSSEMKSTEKSIVLTNNEITPDTQQHSTLEKVTTLQTTPRESIAPVTIQPNTSRDSNKPMKTLDRKINPKTPKLNITHQSLRGASQFGRLDDDDDVCSDSDALWDSVSLSFAYLSASDEDAESCLGFKEN